MASLPLQAEEFVDREFLGEVVAGLSRRQKQLPSRYFYDAVGSALFDAITVLDEYGLTRADERLLRLHGAAIARAAGQRVRVAELGCGSGRKTRWILESLTAPCYHPIDVSEAALAQCGSELARYARVVPFTGEFLEGLEAVAGARGSEPLLVLFLGSTIGNFAADEAVSFLRRIRGLLREGDSLLIGFDLVKERAVLLDAYDDPTGVTAAFNRNLLARINRELGGRFELRQFEHEVRYDERLQRVEMHLRSVEDQAVEVGAAGRCFEFRQGETIWTESSHKYRPEQPGVMAAACGFAEAQCWMDREWPFAESFWRAV